MLYMFLLNPVSLILLDADPEIHNRPLKITIFSAISLSVKMLEKGLFASSMKHIVILPLLMQHNDFRRACLVLLNGVCFKAVALF